MFRERLAARAGALLLALLVGAMEPYTHQLSPQDFRHIRTIAIIPALGSTFLFQHVRDKPFEWLGPPDSHFLEISDWGLDAIIAHDAATALGKRFVVAPIAFVRADFSTWNEQLLKHASLNLNGDPGIDAYVFVLRDWRGDQIGHSVHALGGLGFYRRDRTHKGAISGVFASYRVVVVNALTGDIIASHAALTPNGKLPWLPANADLWPKTQNDLSDPQQAALIADERQLIEKTLLPTLKAMNLAN